MAVKILSGGAVEGLVRALNAEFVQATGIELVGDFGAVGGMKERVVSGEPVDVIILTRQILDDLAAKELVTPETISDVGLVETCIAIRSGDPKPSVENQEELRSALLAADAIHLPDPETSTGGIHFAGVLRKLGIDGDVRDQMRPFPNGMTAMAALAASTAKQPIGCTQVTEIRSTDGVEFVAPLPPGYDLSTMYTAGISVNAGNPDAARALVRLLTATDQETARRNAGFSN
ncbi:MAG: substrate-binding domain-containing protein [Hyphomicrobiaceae bacterium]